MVFRIRSTSASGAKTAAIFPVSFTATRVIPRPRALTASSASSKVSEPDATSAPYSPRLCPMVMSGLDAVGVQQPGQCQVDGEHSGLSNLRLAQIFFSFRDGVRVVWSTKMNSLSGLPSSGVMMRSASAKSSATIGSAARSGSIMLTYCEPWPVYRNATLRSGTASAKDALRPQSLPDWGLIGS